MKWSIQSKAKLAVHYQIAELSNYHIFLMLVAKQENLLHICAPLKKRDIF